MTPIEIQKALNAAGFGPVAIDGVFGPKTIDAIKRFQRANFLMPDGRAGPKTQEALAAKISAPVAKGSVPSIPAAAPGRVLLTKEVLRAVCPFAKPELVAAIVS